MIFLKNVSACYITANYISRDNVALLDKFKLPGQICIVPHTVSRRGLGEHARFGKPQVSDL